MPKWTQVSAIEVVGFLNWLRLEHRTKLEVLRLYYFSLMGVNPGSSIDVCAYGYKLDQFIHLIGVPPSDIPEVVILAYGYIRAYPPRSYSPDPVVAPDPVLSGQEGHL